MANFWGSNSAPAWSPDGRRLAVVLTKDGGSQIYLVNADGSGVTRLTQSSAIDTEPNFSPDGELLLFTSDRGGSPQIYGMAAKGGEARRLTFEGTYNVSPRFNPDGKSFTFIQRNGSRFNVAVQDMTTRQVQVLTDGAADESPSFAPNGRMILYATEVRGRGILSAVSSDGRVKQRLTADAGDVREPAWARCQSDVTNEEPGDEETIGQCFESGDADGLQQHPDQGSGRRVDRRPHQAGAAAPARRQAQARRRRHRQAARGQAALGETPEGPGNILSKRSIFFDYDSNWSGRSTGRSCPPTPAPPADPAAKMRVEGTADDRGSREYNLALGQRRADAVNR